MPASLARHRDPIVSVATAPGRGAVGIVRVSGPALEALAEALAPALATRGRPARQAVYGPFLAADGTAIDHGLAIWFAAPHSYTGEQVLELQAHGGPVVLQLLLARCLQAGAERDALTGAPRCAGLRIAQPGEFTQRAFFNGKLDLAQAEAVADLIDASTEAAARSASRALEGAFSREVHALARDIVELRALVEATLDFPEEEIDFLEQVHARERLQRLFEALDAVQARARQGALLREGLRVVLAGQPNVGKSSLLNALAGAELAIVTPIAGTTRDRIGQALHIEGVPLHVMDTAGLRGPGEASDEVERIGMARSWEAIEQADLVLFLHDLTRAGEPGYEALEGQIAQRLPPGVGRLDVWNKCDAVAPEARPPHALVVSTVTGQGLAALRAQLLRRAGWQPGAEGVYIARARHLQALALARGHLEAAAAHMGQGDRALELFAEELRLAHEALAAITGEFTADELLGEIFGRFCIGK